MIDRVHARRDTCRACGSERQSSVLSLGDQPLANSFLDHPRQFATELRVPLELFLCLDCGLVHLLDVVHPDVLFRSYVYVTGTSETMARHNEWYASTVREIAELADGDLVVEIASNDGSLLLNFDQSRLRRLGIEPARNIAEIARERGLDTIEEFFDERLAETVRGKHGPARAIMANNVLAHVDDTRAFLSGCRTLLAADGLLTIEVPYLGHMIEHVEYDTIYHEHLCYFALSPLLRVFDELDLSVTRVDHVPVHGGSLRIYARPAAFAGAHGAGTLRLAARERQQGLTDEVRLRRFAAAVAKNRRRLLDLIDGIHGDGDSIVAYGAPAKGNTLLNYCGIGPDRIAYTVDMNPLKIGKFTPGAHIPVRPVADLEVHPPDYLLILAWNFAEEIMGQQRFLRDRGTRFVLPIPEPRIL